MTKGTIIQGFDLLDVVGHMINLNRKFQATFLADLEDVVTNEADFIYIRKLYLDSSNNFLRAVIKSIFGDVEI